MAKVSKKPEDRKEEIKEAKEAIVGKFGEEQKPKFEGGVEKPRIEK